MFLSRNHFFLLIGSFLFLVAGLCFASTKSNSIYSDESPVLAKRVSFLSGIPLASPAIVPAGRNIAFESGNALNNAPASYLTMLDCCESDEAIASRIATGNLQAKILKK